MPLDYNKISEQELYECAVAYVRGRGEASTSLLQRHFYIGFSKASRLMDELEKNGIISKPQGKLMQRTVIG